MTSLGYITMLKGELKRGLQPSHPEQKGSCTGTKPLLKDMFQKVTSGKDIY